MKSTKIKSFSSLRKLYPFMVAFFIFIIGYTGIHFYAYTKGQNFTSETNHIVTSKIDDLLTSLHSTTITVLPLIELDCETIKPILEEIVAKNHRIKAINLLKNEKPYCSSENNIDGTNSTNNTKLLLQQHTPDTALMLLDNDIVLDHSVDTTKRHRIIITVVSFEALKEILTPRIPTQIITLKLDDHTITYHSIDKETPTIYQPIEEKSYIGYNYTIETGYIYPLNLQILFYFHGIPLLLVILLAFFSYFVTRWFLNNISSTYYELNTAINNNQIKPYTQPIFSVKTGELTGIEILARWHHPQMGIISPDTFIPVAEKTGLIIPLTQKLMKEVAQTLAPFSSSISSNFHIGFNISRQHCENLQLINDCKQFYKQVNNDKIVLVVEITERELIEVTDTTKQLFRELHKLNAKIALDDFGVGNSNLSYLYDFAIDYLKIDKSFISRIGSDALSKNILDAIIEIAQNCKLESCAEGVETEEQANYLKEKGVTYLQGYFFSPPIPIKDFIQSPYFKSQLN
ncbi:EAL domain-containing protein [Entomomonas sp. E2T0]|uniref:EAL domain-containing protein n=1 Tax=Entomomonas sp. E2T0 TaxID=2930213 RepID=UPI0022283804|nr:EAL domain-containing protein [Entomomonas sp. E2T0]UYZ83897.1 EAL domain-containing protein [Entomomonas sp. E2T0]